jgi:hypothetical protein
MAKRTAPVEEPKAQAKKHRPANVPAPEPPPPAPQYDGPVVVMFETVQQWLYTRELMTVTPHTLTGGQILIHARAIECLNQAVPTEAFSRGILDKYFMDQQQKATEEREKLRLQAEAEAYEKGKKPGAKPIAANTVQTFKKRS